MLVSYMNHNKKYGTKNHFVYVVSVVGEAKKNAVKSVVSIHKPFQTT